MRARGVLSAAVLAAAIVVLAARGSDGAAQGAGRALVAHRDGELWRIDPRSGRRRPLVPKGWQNAVISPDGRRLAWNSRGRYGGFYQMFGDLYVMRVDGGPRRKLTTGVWGDGEPAFSPDGSRLAFTRRVRGPHLRILSRIAVVPVAGGALRELTTHTTEYRDEHCPAWSPDGRAIAYVVEATDAEGSGTENSIHVMDADGGNDRVLADGATGAAGLSWSPDGRWILFDSLGGGGGRGMTLARPDGSGRRLIAGTRPAFWPAWSPDSRHIAYTTTIAPRPGYHELRARVVGADGRADHLLAPQLGPSSSPAWSPDGSRLAVAHNSGLSIVRPDGHELRRIPGEGYGGTLWSSGEQVLRRACG